jgi:hypothetical protein
MKPKPKIIERPGDRRFTDDSFGVPVKGEIVLPVSNSKEQVGPTAVFLKKLRLKKQLP